MKYGLSDKVIVKMNSVFMQWPQIEEVILYGSRALNTYNNGSDIDLTIVEQQLSLSELMKIENQLDDLLLPYKIDLSLKKTIDNKDLLEHIHRVGQPFYTKA